MSHTDPKKRHDFVLLFEVVNGNPNGDPDAGNMPRTDPETMQGLVTDVCIKRKIRDYAADVLKKEIFIQRDDALNTLYFQAFRAAKDAKDEPVATPLEVDIYGVPELKILLELEESEFGDWLSELEVEGVDYNAEVRKITYIGDVKAKNEFVKRFLGEETPTDSLKAAVTILAGALAKKATKAKKPGKEARQIVKLDLRRKYFDILMFGAVLTAGTNAGQVRGPVQLTFAKSIDPIHTIDLSITRVAITRPADQDRKQTEMGRKSIVPYGLYRAHGFYSPLLARDRNADGTFNVLVGEDDLKALWEALEYMFEFDRSAARPEMNTRGLYVFTHENEKGNAHAYKLFETIKVKQNGGAPRSFEDYRSGIRVPAEGPLEDYAGVALKHLVHHESGAVPTAAGEKIPESS